MIYTVRLENFFKYFGLIVVAIGYIRISISENFNQGKNFILIGLLIQLIGLGFYIYNKKKV